MQRLAAAKFIARRRTSLAGGKMVKAGCTFREVIVNDATFSRAVANYGNLGNGPVGTNSSELINC